MASSAALFVSPTAADHAAEGSVKPGVLLVEDEECLSFMLTQLLKRAKWPVFLAIDGASAVKLMEERGAHIGCAMVDCQLPDMDGAELCAKIRALSPGLPLLLTSGRDQHVLMRELERSGRTGFLPKPYMPADVLAGVSGLLRAA